MAVTRHLLIIPAIHNQRYDQLYEKALTLTDDSARNEVYREMDRLIIEDAPVVPLWYDEVIHLVQPDLDGFAPNGLNLLELRRAHFSHKRK
jgi:peptide/nickel transport system substrate-binding protein